MRPAVACVLAYAIAFAASTCCAAVGDLLFSYESSLGTLPAQQGWSYQTNCLCERCPSNPLPPLDPWDTNECHFQGFDANNCTLGYGCAPDPNSPLPAEHYNAPSIPREASGACSHTEWLAFDDGEDFLDSTVPVALPNRNLTFGGDQSATFWGPHAHPAFGAPAFVNAPVGYPPLRMVTGGGVPEEDTLPIAADNDRNRGQLKIYRGYTVPPQTAAVTLVAKMACGNRWHMFEMIQINGFGHGFSLGVDGRAGSETSGQFTRGTTQTHELDIFTSRQVQVAIARKEHWGPHSGEFFTVRIILNSNGLVEAWLNDDPATCWMRTTGAGIGSNVQISPDEQAGTMWVDYIRLYEGAVPPLCGNPVFDVNHDGRVNHLDRLNGIDGFLDCVTGPSPPAGALDLLAERCTCHDVNGDGAIDMIDFAAFQRCLTIDDAPASPSCAD
jgi:hypothetical protein